MTVTLKAAPAVVGLGKPVTTRVRRGPTLTVMPLWVPVMVPVAVSVAVIDWVPAVLSVTREGVLAGVAAGEGVVGRQAGLGVAAGEVDRAGVAGGDVAVGVMGGDGDVVGRPRRGRARGSRETVSVLAAGRVDRDVLGAGDGAGRPCRWR